MLPVRVEDVLHRTPWSTTSPVSIGSTRSPHRSRSTSPAWQARFSCFWDGRRPSSETAARRQLHAPRHHLLALGTSRLLDQPPTESRTRAWSPLAMQIHLCLQRRPPIAPLTEGAPVPAARAVQRRASGRPKPAQRPRRLALLGPVLVIGLALLISRNRGTAARRPRSHALSRLRVLTSIGLSLAKAPCGCKH